MSAQAERDVHANHEVFTCNEHHLSALKRSTDKPAQWKLGFGPVGDGYPVWGLFRLGAHGADTREHEVLWRLNPKKTELLRWTTRKVGIAVANSLLDAVGDIDNFYAQYFASRPNLLLPDERARPASPVVHAATAFELSLLADLTA